MTKEEKAIVIDALNEACGWNWLDPDFDPPESVAATINRAFKILRKEDCVRRSYLESKHNT